MKHCRVATRVALILAALVMPLLTAFPVFAIADPDSLSINSVYAYRYLTSDDETGQGYLVDFNVDYAVVPSEVITEAFLVSIIDTDGTTILATVSPYTFVTSGYGHNIAWIHFDGDDASLPTWSGAYTVRLYGNPTLAWSGDPPSDSSGIGNWSTAVNVATAQGELAERVLFLANQLELEWGTVTLIEKVASGGSVLATDGETLYMNVIEGIRNYAPAAFASGSTLITPTQFTYTPDPDMSGDTAGTPLDMSGLETATGIGETMIQFGMWLVVTVLLMGLVVRFVPNGMKVVGLLLIPCAIGGVRLGMIDVAVAFGFGALGIVGAAFLLFGNKSSV